MVSPKSRLEKEVDPGNELQPGVEVTQGRRLTRSVTRPSDSGSVQQPPKKKAKKNKGTEAAVNDKEEISATEKVGKLDITSDETHETAATGSGSGSNSRTIIIEHCKQCNAFKTRAVQVKAGLEAGVPGITVLLNPDKPRRGCFEIREEGGEAFISLLNMKRPFQKMKDLDMDKVIADIVGKIKD